MNSEKNTPIISINCISMGSKPQLRLFVTSHCHLCDQAITLISTQCDQFHLELIEIFDNAKLMEKYGMLIPVLQRTDTMTELIWPFDSDDITRLIQQS